MIVADDRGANGNELANIPSASRDPDLRLLGFFLETGTEERQGRRRPSVHRDFPVRTDRTKTVRRIRRQISRDRDSDLAGLEPAALRRLIYDVS